MYPSKPRRRTLTSWMFLAALLSAVAAGCSKPTGTVSGRVTFEGQPMPAGTVTFVHADGTTMSGSIREGSYSIDKVPTGSCTILVVSLPSPRKIWNPQTKEKVGEGTSEKFQQAMSLPARYNDPKQSDLHHEVTAGSQTYNIELKP